MSNRIEAAKEAFKAKADEMSITVRGYSLAALIWNKELEPLLEAAIAAADRVEGEGWNEAIEKAAHVAETFWGRQQDMRWGKEVAKAIRVLSRVSAAKEETAQTLYRLNEQVADAWKQAAYAWKHVADVWRGRVSRAKAKRTHEVFECCRGIVRAYGPNDLPEHVRDALCKMMDHYERTAQP